MPDHIPKCATAMLLILDRWPCAQRPVVLAGVTFPPPPHTRGRPARTAPRCVAPPRAPAQWLCRLCASLSLLHAHDFNRCYPCRWWNVYETSPLKLKRASNTPSALSAPLWHQEALSSRPHFSINIFSLKKSLIKHLPPNKVTFWQTCIPSWPIYFHSHTVINAPNIVFLGPVSSQRPYTHGVDNDTHHRLTIVLTAWQHWELWQVDRPPQPSEDFKSSEISSISRYII